MEVQRIQRTAIQALKIGIGSSLAILIAEALGLQNATSAGTIALLTIVTSKVETIKLSLYRVLTFVIFTGLAWIWFMNLDLGWEAYGIYIFIMVLVSEIFGMKSTISVNSVIGAHYLITRDFSMEFILNEFLLVVIGSTLAIILNVFSGNKGRERVLKENMRDVEERLKMVLGGLTAYLTHFKMERDIWQEIYVLERDLKEYIADAADYKGNTFTRHTNYYTEYFEMRLQQLGILHSLHGELERLREVPSQAEIIADYILELTDAVTEFNMPEVQIQKLEDLLDHFKTEPLPHTRENFENRAILYHILMDLEDFLMFKQRFVESMTEKQKETYWK